MSKTYFGVDGFQRPPAEDQRISKDDAELRHLEGQRYLVGVIERRISHAQRMKQNG